MNYRRQKQAFKHDPENGVYGDCSRTVTACLLGIPRDMVPHVHKEESTQEFFAREDAYLASKGLWRMCIAFEGAMPIADVLHHGKTFSRGHEYALVGKSRNGTNHIVICEQDYIAWDTAIDDSGIVGPSDDGYWWLEFIVREI